MESIKEIKDHISSTIELLGKLEVEVNDAKRAGDQLGEFPYRVMHLKNNPVRMATHSKAEELEESKKEIERLRARLELLESGNNADVTRRIDEAVNNAHQVDMLTQKVRELKQRETKILDSFRKTSREFREVCYLLTGYKIYAHREGIYRLTHMYADCKEDELLFQVSPDGVIQLLQSNYSDRLSEHISTYLQNADSFPAFLASITLDLFKSSTQLAPMSMCMSTTMSTTIKPNPNFNPSRD